MSTIGKALIKILNPGKPNAGANQTPVWCKVKIIKLAK